MLYAVKPLKAQNLPSDVPLFSYPLRILLLWGRSLVAGITAPEENHKVLMPGPT